MLLLIAFGSANANIVETYNKLITRKNLEKAQNILFMFSSDIDIKINAIDFYEILDCQSLLGNIDDLKL